MGLLAIRSQRVKELAKEVGFLACGISKVQRLDSEAERLESWLHKGYHGKMAYMENHFEKRLDPGLLVPGSKSVISLLFNYYPEKEMDGKAKLSKYAYGEDYHHVVKGHMAQLVERMEEEFGKLEGRAFVDSAPVLERAWASKAGLGWIGKHSLLLSKQTGSFYFIAQLILDLALEEDGPTTDHCGSCTACIDACPTEAIVADRVIDSRKCISYLTIELKEEIPSGFRDQLSGWAFGCDICQDVCPWNRFSKPHSEDAFRPTEALEGMLKSDWQELTEEVFGEIFKKSAVKRAGFIKLKRSIAWNTEDGTKQ